MVDIFYLPALLDEENKPKSEKMWIGAFLIKLVKRTYTFPCIGNQYDCQKEESNVYQIALMCIHVKIPSNSNRETYFQVEISIMK